ncbi:MAG: 4'-phosphopantetheinyl transferase superfamily protein [Myxococcota bacterium]
MIETLLPEGVAFAESEIPDPPEPLHPDETALAEAMGPRRRPEFHAGRACARRALAQLGVHDRPVLRGARRAPLWPTGCVGAITHTDAYCAAVAAHDRDWAGVGLDAELRKPLSTRALERICSPEECAHLRALPGTSAEAWGNVVFSAKESLYKAYFPQTEVYLGFRDAALELDPERGRFAIRLVNDEVPDLAGRRAFEGRFAIATTRVYTFLAAPAAH